MSAITSPSAVKSNFNKFLKNAKTVIWPIKKRELKKFLPLALLMFFILFVNSALRILKDSVVIPTAGAEVVQFIKISFTLPVAILSTIGYAKLISRFHYENVFYIIIAVFAAFFTFALLVLVPYGADLEPSPANIEALIAAAPRWQWVIKIYANWTKVALFVVCELWGSLMFNLLFWHFANHINTTAEARKSYVIIGLIGNSALILSGYLMQQISYFSNVVALTDNCTSNPTDSLMVTTITMMLLCCAIITAIYRWMNVVVVPDPKYVKIRSQKSFEHFKIKKKQGFWESITIIAKSPYLKLIAILLLSYGVCIGLAEGVWRYKAKELFNDSTEYASFMGLYQQWVGITSFAFAIIGSNVVRILPWRYGAAITPCIFLLAGSGFFCFCIFDQQLHHLFGIASSGALEIAVYLGTMQVILSKSSKYTVFDASKELAYIPLDDELKTKGKAAIDVVGPHAGKSISAFLQACLLLVFPVGGYQSITPILGFTFVSAVILWLATVFKLGKLYEAKLQETTDH